MDKSKLSELMVKVKNDRDQIAFSNLFDFLAPKLKAYFIQNGLSADISEELTQEVMSIIWSKSDRYDSSKSAVTTWVYTIARNKKVDFFRKSAKINVNDDDIREFLYENDGMLVFMDTETFEQIELPSDLLGDRRPFLQDGMQIVVEFYDDEALNASLPAKVVCQIVETEPVVKGQTAANSFKPAILDNGVKVMVPPFISQDEAIVVNTETMEYSERA